MSSEEQVTIELKGAFGSVALTAPGLVLDGKLLRSFSYPEDSDHAALFGQGYAYYDGQAWNKEPAPAHGPSPADRLEELSLHVIDRADLYAFIDGRPICGGKWAQVEWDYGPEDETILRVDGWACARRKDEHWYRQDRRGDLHELGLVTIGPFDLHE